MTAKRLILIRHGQTFANVRMALDTRLPGAPLTDAGVVQSRRLAKSLHLVLPEDTGCITTSLALRAMQTGAATVGSLHKISGSGTRLQHIEGLHEVQAGDLEGRNDFDAHRLFFEVFHQWMLGNLDVGRPGGDTAETFLNRYLPAVAEVIDSPRDTEIIITHGAAMRLATSHLTGLGGEFMANNPLANTQRIELEFAGDETQPVLASGQWALTRWGDLSGEPLQQERQRWE